MAQGVADGDQGQKRSPAPNQQPSVPASHPFSSTVSLFLYSVLHVKTRARMLASRPSLNPAD